MVSKAERKELRRNPKGRRCKKARRRYDAGLGSNDSKRKARILDCREERERSLFKSPCFDDDGSNSSSGQPESGKKGPNLLCASGNERGE